MEEPIVNVDKPYTDPITGKFLEGNPGGGRPKGSISPITRVKQIFEQDPTKFEDFITEYIKDPANRKHIVEMIDGKPKQSLDMDLQGALNLGVVILPEKNGLETTTDTEESTS